jgi:hypothetical protein
MDALKSGLHQVVPLDYINRFSEYELQMLISGVKMIDLHDWKAHTKYKVYNIMGKRFFFIKTPDFLI